MEISQIKYFCVLVEAGHMRKAAEMLGLSPGAMSKSMKELQSRSGRLLFVPSGRGLEITDEGKRFYVQAQRVLAEYQFLANRATSETVYEPQVRIASLELFTSHFTATMIKADFPTERFVVLERLPGKIEESVINREVDIGITYAPLPNKGLDFLKITTFEKRIYIRKGAFRGVPVSEIPFSGSLIPVLGSPVGVTSLDGWPLDVPRNVMYQFELLETALHAARLGICAAFCPHFVVELQNQMVQTEFQLQEIPMPDGMKPLKRTVFIVKRSEDPEGPTIKKLAKNLRRICSLK